ncbi:MAG: protein CapI [Candidatus Marinimicrobia bacterium]|nr:protein CapI [Candidatus Neomarinimicrobiota bacterium]|tara:strand:+ start:13671 stop:14627 length:957 start_codon:yes stop_codon:yes gene_type:complete
MKILLTGSAGFIGYHLSKSLLLDEHEVLGIDSLNDYYNVNLKKDRLNKLKKFSNFIFKHCDLKDKETLSDLFNSFKPQKVINLAAQAGVRYSIENPHAYVDSNLVGYLNIIDLCRHNDVDGFIYASSSSVYGANKKIPFSISDRVDKPIALYGATKRANELIAFSYSHLYDLHTTGLRFFTVYGPWGRPDMAMYIFTKNILEKTPIAVFNDGNMKRDFTYIDDIILGTKAAINMNYKCEIFNLGNNKSEELMDVISIIEQNLGEKAIINFLPMQPGDVKESFADISYSVDKLGFSPKTNVKEGINNFIKWYKEYNNVK